MSTNWNNIWTEHADVFVAQNWQECQPEKRKAWRLPAQFAYYMGGETGLRVGIVACPKVASEEEFLLAAVLWGNRLSNGAKTIIYLVAPDFSPFLLHALPKFGERISLRAVYWREKLTPSLYLIPDSHLSMSPLVLTLGEERQDWQRWIQGFNPVAQQQLEVVRKFFSNLGKRGIRMEIKTQQVSILSGNIEIAEIKRRGRKFELYTKTKWEKAEDRARNWQKSGWVDVSGHLNQEFCRAVENILEHLENLEREGSLRPRDLLSLKIHHDDGILSAVWGKTWEWPWLPKERGDSFMHELGNWLYFQGNGQVSVVCPILERPMGQASLSILLAGVLENSNLLKRAQDQAGGKLSWDGRIHWLTLPALEDDLRRWQCWLKDPDQFPIWTLPENWQAQGLRELSCLSPIGRAEITRTIPL